MFNVQLLHQFLPVLGNFHSDCKRLFHLWTIYLVSLNHSASVKPSTLMYLSLRKVINMLSFELAIIFTICYKAEITRLQNSLVHLKETQKILEAELNASTECDPEISKAFEENKVVMCVFHFQRLYFRIYIASFQRVSRGANQHVKNGTYR